MIVIAALVDVGIAVHMLSEVGDMGAAKDDK